MDPKNRMLGPHCRPKVRTNKLDDQVQKDIGSRGNSSFSVEEADPDRKGASFNPNHPDVL